MDVKVSPVTSGHKVCQVTSQIDHTGSAEQSQRSRCFPQQVFTNLKSLKSCLITKTNVCHPQVFWTWISCYILPYKQVYHGKVSGSQPQYFLRYELFPPYYFPPIFGQVQTTDRQTESDAYEPIVQLAQVGLKMQLTLAVIPPLDWYSWNT